MAHQTLPPSPSLPSLSLTHPISSSFLSRPPGFSVPKRHWRSKIKSALLNSTQLNSRSLEPETSFTMSETKSHILIVPYPAQGHMIPLLDFTHLLAIRGIAITILITPKNLPLLNPILTKNPSIQTLILPFPAHPNIPAGVENVKDLPAGGFRAMMYTLCQLQNPVVQWFKNHPSPPTAIVHDIFMGFCHRISAEIGVPAYVFSPSGALPLAIIYSLWRDFPKRRNPSDDNEMISFPKVPKCPIYPWWQLSPIYRSYVADDELSSPISKSIRANFDGDLASYGLLINTFYGLENIYLDNLKELLGHNRVWAVGPVLPPNDHSSSPVERGGSSSISAAEVSSWLDKCGENAVVYVCFGSQAVLTNEQMEALTMALEKSGVKFILSVKGATKGHEEVEKYGQFPSGFESRVAGRGLIIKGWAPQVLILRHRSTGAFLTHCGWNSVLEGIVSGVPMLAWPMGADQFSNATLIVDELKIGVRVCEGDETVPDADEMGKVLAKAINGFEEERKRSIELQKAASDAVTDGGSSFQCLDDLATHFCTQASKTFGAF